MKKIILSAALLAFTFSFSQKKEVAAAYKAIESGDVATANAQITAADAVLSGNTHLLEPETLEQYYYTKGVLLLKSGKTAEGASYLAKINELGKSKIYSGKDSSKNRVHYVGKAAADASGISGLKEETYQTTTPAKFAALVNPKLQAASTAAMDAYNNKNYGVAAGKFKEAYDLLKAVGQTNGQMLYNAGLSYISAKDNNKAIEIFNELINSGYTGVETTYTAKEKSTGKVESFDKVTWDALKKSTDFSDFKVESTPSIEKELYETYVKLLVNEGKFNDAIMFSERGLKKFPNDVKLTELQSISYYKSGKTAEFTQSLKNQLAKNPNDAISWYNLGVLQSNDSATKAEAEANFNKALQLDPKMDNAYQNLAYLIMGDDDETINEYKALRNAKNFDKANKLMDERRERFKKALPVVERWYNANPNNLEAVSLLKGLYQSTHNDAKAAEFKAKEAALKAQQGK